MGVFQRIGNQRDILQVRKKFEQRIAGLGDKNFVVGIAEQPENIRISFAGAGCKKDGLGIHSRVMVLEVVARYFFARRQQSTRLWFIGERSGIAESIENGGSIIVETAIRGIGSSQIENRCSGSTKLLQSLRVTVGRECPVSALREHEGEEKP